MNKKSKATRLREVTLASISVLGLSACGALHDMKEATFEMNRTTKEMNAKTSELLTVSKQMQTTTEEMNKKTTELQTSTDKMREVTVGMGKNTEELLSLTQSMKKTTEEMNQKTTHLSDTTDQMAKTTQGMADRTEHMSSTTDRMANTTDQMAATTKDMAARTEHMSSTTDRMANTTDHMANTTDHMASTTDSMAKVTTEMAKTTHNLASLTQKMSDNFYLAFNDGRMDTAKRGREDELKVLATKTDLASKFAHAGIYYYSMEFQFWDPSIDTVAQRDVMFKNMMTEYMDDMHNYIHSPSDVGNYLRDVTKYAITFEMIMNNQQQQDLYALVAAMHTIGETQVSALNKANSKLAPESVLSLIEKSLSAKRTLEKQNKELSTLPEYQQVVLDFEQDAIYMLQLRQLFLRGLVLCRSAIKPNGRMPSKIEQSWDFLRTKTQISKTWTPTINNQNAAQINVTAEALELAIETTRFLRSIGVTPMKSDFLISNLWSTMDLTSTQKFYGAKQRAITRFNAALATLKKVDAMMW